MPDGNLFSAAEAEDGLPPHDVDAEQALIGAVLFDNETYHRVSDYLRAEHFYEPMHGRVFDAAGSLIARGDVADPITLAPLAETDPALKSMGGKGYLTQLMTQAPSTAAARDYARFIYDLALRRSLIRVGGEIEDEAKKDRQTAARELIEGAERKLFDLAESGSANKGFVTFTEALGSRRSSANTLSGGSARCTRARSTESRLWIVRASSPSSARPRLMFWTNCVVPKPSCSSKILLSTSAARFIAGSPRNRNASPATSCNSCLVAPARMAPRAWNSEAGETWESNTANRIICAPQPRNRSAMPRVVLTTDCRIPG